MLLYHVTTAPAAELIKLRGLRVSCSRGRRLETWFASPRQLEWALAHVAERRGVSPRSLVVLVVDVPEYLLMRRRRGRYTVGRDIPACRVRAAFAAGDFAYA